MGSTPPLEMKWSSQRRWQRTGAPWRCAWTAGSSSATSSAPANAAYPWLAHDPVWSAKLSPCTCLPPDPAIFVPQKGPSTKCRRKLWLWGGHVSQYFSLNKMVETLWPGAVIYSSCLFLENDSLCYIWQVLRWVLCMTMVKTISK